jgi:hypothetical protein
MDHRYLVMSFDGDSEVVIHDFGATVEDIERLGVILEDQAITGSCWTDLVVRDQ